MELEEYVQKLLDEVIMEVDDDLQYLFIPFNTSRTDDTTEGHHWTLLQFDWQKPEWTHYNSLIHTTKERCLADARRLKERVLVPINKRRKNTKQAHAPENQEIIQFKCQQQTEWADCGMYICKFMEDAIMRKFETSTPDQNVAWKMQ